MDVKMPLMRKLRRWLRSSLPEKLFLLTVALMLDGCSTEVRPRRGMSGRKKGSRQSESKIKTGGKEAAAKNAKLDTFLQKSNPGEIPGLPKIIIAPSGLLESSGEISTGVYGLLARYPYVKTVVVLGDAGAECKTPGAVWADPEYRSEYGVFKVNMLAAKRLLPGGVFAASRSLPDQTSRDFGLYSAIVNKALPKALVLPVGLNITDSRDLPRVARELSRLTRADSVMLLAVSSLSRGLPTEGIARRVDRNTLRSLLAIDAGVADHVRRSVVDLRPTGMQDTFSAPYVAFSAVKVAQLLAMDSVSVLGYENRPDETGLIRGNALLAFSASTKKYVPGGKYADGALRPPLMQRINLPLPVRAEALRIAREAVEASVVRAKYNAPEPTYKALREVRPVFVTLFAGGKERGSAGDFHSGRPLFEAIAEAARAAATEDMRVYSHPVSDREAKRLKIEICLPFTPEAVSSWEEVCVGVDGVIVERAGRRGVVLPKVAERNGWGREQLLRFACGKKAGMPTDAFLRPGIFIYTFSAEIFSQAP